MPARNFSNARSRALCGRSACMTSAEMPADLRRLSRSSARCLVRQKTSTRSGCTPAAPPADNRASSSWVFCPWVTGQRCSSTVSAVSPTCATSITTGSLSMASTVPLIEGGIVAEKSSVWRSSGHSFTMRRTLGQKPMSSMRSASSSTRTCTSLSETWPCSMRSIRRPGVATSRSQPLSSPRICRSNFAPPMTTTALWPVCSHTVVTTPSICAASSRVGVTIRANGPKGCALALGLRMPPCLLGWVSQPLPLLLPAVAFP